MSTPAKKNSEALFLKYMFKYGRDFASEENKLWYDIYEDYSIEGGDVLVLSKDVVAIGYSQRTTIDGIERFARTFYQILILRKY